MEFKQERREVSGFSKVVFKATGKIELTQGSCESLAIEYAHDLSTRIKTEVIDQTLVVSYCNDWLAMLGVPINSTEAIRFHLGMKTIEELTIDGFGILAAAKVNTKKLRLVLNGPGVIQISNIAVEDLDVKISGVGSIQVCGQAQSQKVQISGAGSYKSRTLESERALVNLSGIGNANLCAKEFLAVNISGAGGVEYSGQPQIVKKITGLGMLKYIGDR